LELAIESSSSDDVPTVVPVYITLTLPAPGTETAVTPFVRSR